jgi:uncharacterized protein
MSIPRTVSASKAVAHGEIYEGDLDVAQLPRLKEEVGDAGGNVHARWRAGQDAGGYPEVEGRLNGQLALTCQRCLLPFDWPFDINVTLQLVRSEAEAARLLQECEPYEVQDDVLPLRDMTEDEVLLALPLMPRCKTCENAAPSAAPPQPDEPKRSNPFAALKKLKF